ncbi:MAG: anthranilate phosphoribosyltransferase [Fusobacteria bacterium]|nr:anthranilate phosphoribosyltransferase [Fusobacteriota bacterium]
MIRDAIARLLKMESLTESQMIAAMEDIMEGRASDILITSFLTGLRIKGETAEEITGGAKVMRSKAHQINLDDIYTLDTCGTGGDRANTFNISTATAFVAAAADIYIAKHGNRSVSSRSGSADVLEYLGANITLTPEKVEKCVRDIKIGFFFAPSFHKAMKHTLEVRKELAVRTIFNILGPLTNPASANSQVMGVFNPDLTDVMAHVLQNLNVEKALVVHGLDGLDEISLAEDTKVSELRDGIITNYYINPEQFGIKRAVRKEIEGGERDVNGKIILDIFNGVEQGAKRDVVLLNSGAALYVGKKANSILEGVELAKEIIDSGKAMKKLDEFIKYTKNI